MSRRRPTFQQDLSLYLLQLGVEFQITKEKDAIVRVNITRSLSFGEPIGALELLDAIRSVRRGAMLTAAMFTKTALEEA